MKKKRRRRRLILFLFLLTVCIGGSATAERIGADAGSFRGNSSHSRSGSSSRSRPRSSRSGRRDGSDSGFWTFVELIALSAGILISVIVSIVMAIRGRIRKHRRRSGKGKDDDEDDLSGGMMEDEEQREAAEGSIRENDPEFKMDVMRRTVKDLYVKMQTQWMRQDWEPMREHLSPQLYRQFERQLHELQRDGLTNIMEEIHVTGVNFLSYEQDGVNDILTMALCVRMKDYTVDRTGEVVVGSKQKPVYLYYDWELIRTRAPRGLTSEERTCPSCGAPMDINASTCCPYCGSVVEAKSYGWVINRIEAVNQSDEPLI